MSETWRHGEDHQLVLGFTSGKKAEYVSCTCLGYGRGNLSHRVIEQRKGTFPARAAIASWRAWHEINLSEGL
jgi:hypothetical protein